MFLLILWIFRRHWRSVSVNTCSKQTAAWLLRVQWHQWPWSCFNNHPAGWTHLIPQSWKGGPVDACLLNVQWVNPQQGPWVTPSLWRNQVLVWELLTIYSWKSSVLEARARQFDIDNQWRLWAQELFALYPHGCKLPFSTRNQNLPRPFLRAWPSGGSWLSWVSAQIYLLFPLRLGRRVLTTCYWMWNNP